MNRSMSTSLKGRAARAGTRRCDLGGASVGACARCSLALAALVAGALTSPALAQDKPAKPERHGVFAAPEGKAPDFRTPPMNEGVLKALEAAYLSDSEKARLQVFHGVWNDADLDQPALRAAAALCAGVYDDPALSDPAAAVEDRAEALLIRGEPTRAAVLLAGATSPRSVRLRVECLEAAGKLEEADAACEPLVAMLARESASAADLTEGIRAMRVRGRIRGATAGDYGRMMQLLAHAQEDLDRLYWPAVLEQADLLVEKGNEADAEKALKQVLAMNPACARAWRLMGEMSVDGFAFDATEKIAGRLRAIASRFTPATASPDAGVILARARLRQNAPEDAQAELDAVLRGTPGYRGALSLNAAAAAGRFDFDEVEKRCAAMDALWATPATDKNGPWSALFAAGRALAETRQYDRAADYFRRAAARAPHAPEPLVELGLLDVQAGKDVEARDVLKRAVELDPFQTRALNSKKLVDEIAGYASIQSEHFTVRYKPGVDEVVAKELVTPLEKMHKVVCDTFEHSPAQKTIIELYPDHEWFAVRITGMPGIHTIAASTGPIIAMEAPRDGPNHFGVYDWERVVRHEFTHTVNLSQTGYRIPHWFTEAAAVNLELAPYDYPTWQLLTTVLVKDELFDLREINEAFVRPKKPTDRQQAYMQGNWMYRYIVDKWGKSAPIRLMERFATGEREDKAFPVVLGVNTERFMDDFRLWAAADARKWGMLPSPSLDELRLSWMLAQDSERAGLNTALRRAGVASAALTSGLARVNDPSSAVEFDLAPPMPEMVDGWLKEHPDHPDLLDLKVTDALTLSEGKVTPELVPMLEHLAMVRPADPTPHRLLARYFLASSEGAQAVPHLEYLDIREQYSPVYAAELSKQYAAAGDLDKAWEKIERATRISGYDGALREDAAKIALKRKQFKDAERHIEALVALEPNQEIHRKRLEAVRKMMQGG